MICLPAQSIFITQLPPGASSSSPDFKKVAVVNVRQWRITYRKFQRAETCLSFANELSPRIDVFLSQIARYLPPFLHSKQKPSPSLIQVSPMQPLTGAMPRQAADPGTVDSHCSLMATPACLCNPQLPSPRLVIGEVHERKDSTWAGLGCPVIAIYQLPISAIPLIPVHGYIPTHHQAVWRQRNG